MTDTYDSGWYKVGLSFTRKQRRKTRFASTGLSSNKSSLKLVQLEEIIAVQYEEERITFDTAPGDDFTDHAPDITTDGVTGVISYDGSYNRITGKATEHQVRQGTVGNWVTVGTEIVRSSNA